MSPLLKSMISMEKKHKSRRVMGEQWNIVDLPSVLDVQPKVERGVERIC